MRFKQQNQSNPILQTTKLPLFEALETRQLLSAALAPVIKPNIVILHPSKSVSASAQNGSISGYSPSQIRAAYGFDQLSNDGAGQTIAIIDAYNDPNIQNDLKVFNQAFGLPDANLTVVNQTGGSKLPTTDSGWAGEIALDVEWAHAIAPQAKIFVELNNPQHDLAHLLGENTVILSSKELLTSVLRDRTLDLSAHFARV